MSGVLGEERLRGWVHHDEGGGGGGGRRSLTKHGDEVPATLQHRLEKRSRTRWELNSIQNLLV